MTAEDIVLRHLTGSIAYLNYTYLMLLSRRYLTCYSNLLIRRG